MNKILVRTFFIFTIILCFGCIDNPSIRAKEFIKNAYNGNNMQSDKWFTKSGQSMLNTFGGINALVRDCSNEAKRNQGLKEINIISIKQENKLTLIGTEIVFNNGTKKTGEDAWIKEDGKWKITPKENNVNNK